MRLRTLFILAALVAGLGAFIGFYERELPSSEKRAELAKRLLSLAADEVSGLAIDAPAGRVRLERSPAAAGARTQGDEGAAADAGEGEAGGPEEREWRLVEPFASRADGVAADRLVADLAELERLRSLEGAAAADVGLDRPRATVSLTVGMGEGAETVTLKVGGEVPSSDQVVVEVSGRPGFHVVRGSFWADLARAPGDWRSRELFPGRREAIERLTLTGEKGRVLLARRGDAFWVEAPFADRADRQRIDDLLFELTGLSAERFLDAPPPAAELGLESPAGVIEAVLSRRSEPVRVELGIAPPEAPERRYARLGEQVVEIGGKLTEALARPSQEWRSRDLAAFEPFEVDSLEVADAAGKLAARRVEGEWERDGARLPYTPVSDFLYAVADAAASEVLEAAAATGRGVSIATPSLTVTWSSGEGKEQKRETLSLYPAVGEAVPARSADRSAILLLPPSAAAEITAKLAALRQAEPVKEDAGADAAAAAPGDAGDGE